MLLARREKIIVIFAAALLFTLLFYQFGWVSAQNKQQLWDRRIMAKEKELKDVVALSEEYLRLKEEMEIGKKAFLQEGKDFAIFSFLEDLAAKAGVKGNIIYMKPSTTNPSELYKESSVEIKLEGVNLKQITDYLYRIENSDKVLKIKKVNIKPKTQNKQLLDITFLVSAFYHNA